MHNLRHCHKPTLRATTSGNSSGHHADRTLIQRVLNGDTAAYREFEERYRGLIYAILRIDHICGQDQEDIYQEVYVRLWAQNMRRLRLWQDTGMNSFSLYLAVIVRNLISDWYRKWGVALLSIDSVGPEAERGRTSGIDTPHASAELTMDFDCRLLINERGNAVREAIGRLRARDADLIQRRYYAEQSYQEIAEALGMTIANVGAALFHARIRLGRHLYRLQPELFVAIPAKRMHRQKPCPAA